MCRVSQNPIYTVYNCIVGREITIYTVINGIYTVLANPKYVQLACIEKRN